MASLVMDVVLYLVIMLPCGFLAVFMSIVSPCISSRSIAPSYPCCPFAFVNIFKVQLICLSISSSHRLICPLPQFFVHYFLQLNMTRSHFSSWHWGIYNLTPGRKILSLCSALYNYRQKFAAARVELVYLPLFPFYRSILGILKTCVHIPHQQLGLLFLHCTAHPSFNVPWISLHFLCSCCTGRARLPACEQPR